MKKISDLEIPTKPEALIGFLSKHALGKLISLMFNNKFGRPLQLEMFQIILLQMLWTKKFPMIIASRGGGKSFILALYALLRALLCPGSQVIVLGSVFRQGKIIMQYIEELITFSPIVQETLQKHCKGRIWGVRYGSDRATLDVGTSKIISLPLGDGSRARGQRATHLIIDEMASVDPKVFDHAVAPFLSTHADPSLIATKTRVVDKLAKLGISQNCIDLIEDNLLASNQMVISGTPHYEFNHFFKRYSIYMAMAKSNGNEEILKNIIREISPEYGRGKIPQYQIDLYKKVWKEYVVCQLPYTALPPGFLDESIVMTHKLIMPPTIFGQEYECRFSKDTHGFFKRSQVYEATPQMGDPNEVHFEVIGQPGANYVMGLDPARHNDNFGLVILKLDGAVSKLVYCDAWNKTDFPTSLKRVREVMKRFPNINYIAMDVGGGGQTMADLFMNKTLLEHGELPILQANDEEYKHIQNALRILELVPFNTWAVGANYDLLSDITSKRILFPSRVDEDIIFKQYSRVTNKGDALTEEQRNYVLDRLHGSLDTESDHNIELGIIRNVAQCLDELCAIERTTTPKGHEAFDLPKLLEQPEGLDIRRRDRYTALLLAAYAARVVRGTGLEIQTADWQTTYGGLANDLSGASVNKSRARRRNGISY